MLKFVKQVDISFNPLHPKAEVVRLYNNTRNPSSFLFRQLFARITSPRVENTNPNVKFNLIMKPYNEGEPKVEYTFSK